MRPNISNRFVQLEQQVKSVKIITSEYNDYVDTEDWSSWANAVLNLFEIAFGASSIYFKNFSIMYNKSVGNLEQFKEAKGLFMSAKSDYENGFFTSLEKQVSGEIFSDFVILAKSALSEGNKDVAAVLASAALEDALKKYALLNELEAQDKSMEEVVNALKSKGLVGGAQKSLLETMPKLRNYAMHANWDKIASEDVNSLLGFVEQFLLNKFSI